MTQNFWEVVATYVHKYENKKRIYNTETSLSSRNSMDGIAIMYNNKLIL